MPKKIERIIGIIMLLMLPIGFLGMLISVFLDNWLVGLIIVVGAIIMALFFIGWVNLALKLLD